MQPQSLINITNQSVFYCLKIYSNLIQNCQALICPLLSTNGTTTPDQYHKTSCILLLEIYSNWFLNCRALISPLLITYATPKKSKQKNQSLLYCLKVYSNRVLNSQALICTLLSINATPITVQYHKPSCILLLGDSFKFIYKLPIIDFLHIDHKCNSRPCSTSQNKLYFYCLESYSKLFLNCQALISPFLSTHATPIPFQRHKTSFVLLFVNLFQINYKLPSINLILVDHWCYPNYCSFSQIRCTLLLGNMIKFIYELPCINLIHVAHWYNSYSYSISKNKLNLTIWKCIPIDF